MLQTAIGEVCDDGNTVSGDGCNSDCHDENDSPVAMNDSGITNEDIFVVIDVLANDSDPDSGDVLSISGILVYPSLGSVTCTISGCTYTPDPELSGADMFVYEMCDDSIPSLCDEAQVFIDVIAVDDTPDANDDTATTDEDNFVVTNVLTNDVNLGDGGLVITITT